MKTKKEPQKKDSISKCLGPIADLEKHLPHDWWRTIFNSIYLKTDADVVENDYATVNEVDVFLNISHIEPTDNILDLCCGQGRHALELAKRGYQFISGIDRSRYLIRLAKGRAQKLGLPIKFSEGDARKIRLGDQTVDCVMIMGNSFGYFEKEDEDLQVLKETNRVLHEGGLLYLDVTDGSWMKEHFNKRSWEWIDGEFMVCRERHLAKDQSRLISRELVIHSEKGVIADQFYAERLYTFEELKSQLSAAGFVNIEKQDNLLGNSSRNQDLGMMANRILITATAPKKSKPKAIKLHSKIHCTVLMGDPRLPDTVKMNGQFNPEDFDTIHRLKDALNQIEGFQFTYFDNHKNLIRTFSQKPPSFVMNLCDEGWNNDPFMELHPTALMEMLNIPYSGAGPECLSICYNKSTVCSIAQGMDIPTPSEIWIEPLSHSGAIPSIFPAIIKPAYGDSSVGITQNAVVHSSEEFVTYFDELKGKMPEVPLLIQEFLEGREFSIGIIGNGTAMEVLPILEADFSHLPKHLPKILGYESKWDPGSPYWSQIQYRKAQIDETIERSLIDSSISLFQRLKCRDYARFDFRMNSQGQVKLLEVNPNPGWCWDGKMAIMARFAGISYQTLLENILKAALERYPKVHHE